MKICPQRTPFLGVFLLLLSTMATGPTGSVVHAQRLADSIVGEFLGYPVTLSSLDAHWIMSLADAARVPLGFEAAPLPPREGKERKIAATGRKLGDVLDELVQMDSRYRWQEDDGVIVVAPESPTDVTYILESRVGPVRFQNVDARHVFRALARLFGRTQEGGPLDTTKFSLDFPGGTLRELLNSVVRAHGSLKWTLGYTRFVTKGRQIFFGLGTASEAGEFSIPPGAVVQGDALENTPEVDPSPEQSDVPILDRIVGRVTGETVTLSGGGLPGGGLPLDVLFRSLKVPMGFQRLPDLPLLIDPGSMAPDAPPPPDAIEITDRPLREALSVAVNLDPRYSWREIDGVIEIRPYDAWRDPEDPLNRPLPRVVVDNRPTSEVIGLIGTLLGKRFDWNGFPETRPISIDVSNGTLVDVLNAVVRAHGNMSWEWEVLSRAAREEHVATIKRYLPKLREIPPAPRYELMFTIPGRGGVGFDIQ